MSIEVKVKFEDLCEIFHDLETYRIESDNLRKELDDARNIHMCYVTAENERENNARKRDEEILRQRLAVLEKKESRNDAFSKYLEEKARILNGIYERFKRKIGDKALPTFKKQLDDAWNEYDKVQKEIVNGNS